MCGEWNDLVDCLLGREGGGGLMVTGGSNGWGGKGVGGAEGQSMLYLR